MLGRLRLPHHWRRLLILPPVLLGAAWLGYQISHRPAPERRPYQEPTRVLRVIAAPQVNAVPRALGLGTAEPGQVWRAVAEVGGRITSIHPQFHSGGFVSEGEVLVQIDATEYELRVQQLEAELAQYRARENELDIRRQNYEVDLRVEQKSLQLARSQLQRAQQLFLESQISESERDQDERTTLQQERTVAGIESTLALLPAEREALAANVLAIQSQLAAAQLDLERTQIVAPFAARLSSASAELHQFVAAGEVLAEAHSRDESIVEAQFSVQDVRPLIRPATDADGGQRFQG